MANLESLLLRLTQHHVEYVVVGGFAAVAHGVSLLTQDIDICCRFTADNLFRLQEAISELHPVHRMTPKRLPLHLTRERCADLKNLYLDTDWGQLDCLGSVLGIGDYEEVAKGSIEIKLGGGRCRVLDINELIKAKEAMGRPRDKETVIQLRAIQERNKGEPSNLD